MLNKSISAHASNGNRPLSFIKLLKKLKCCEDQLRAPVYCQRDRTPDIMNILKQQEFLTLNNIVEDLISLRKEKFPELLRQYKAVHQSPD